MTHKEEIHLVDMGNEMRRNDTLMNKEIEMKVYEKYVKEKYEYQLGMLFKR